MTTTLSFESTLASTPEQLWAWITSFDQIEKEMVPLLRMSVPKGFENLADVSFQPGVPLFRSWILLGGVVPVDFSDLTLLSMTPGVGFVEQSRMGSMKLWRHERTLHPLASGCRITDHLIFQPRLGGRLTVAFVRRFFVHRHKMLKKHLGELATGSSHAQ